MQKSKKKTEMPLKPIEEMFKQYLSFAGAELGPEYILQHQEKMKEVFFTGACIAWNLFTQAGAMPENVALALMEVIKQEFEEYGKQYDRKHFKPRIVN